MNLYVIKRDGNREPFNSEKIFHAIMKAMNETDHLEKDLAQKITTSITNTLITSGENDVDIEHIQDMIEKKLMASNCKDVAKKFIIYRDNREKRRAMSTKVFQEVIKKTKGENIVNANANVDEKSFGGRKNEAAEIIQKEIALNTLMNPEVAAAHNEGYIYQHDLGAYSIGEHNCLFADVGSLLRNGFATRNGDVRPASSFSTACQLVAVIFQAQSQVQFGGVASAHIDYDLAPFVKKSFRKHYIEGLQWVDETCDESMISELQSCEDWSIEDPRYDKHPRAKKYAMSMLEKEGKQAAQGLYHNLNTLESRAGSQVPFSSINLGRDTSPEGRLVTRWIFEASLDGIGKHRLTSIFPISIFQYKYGVNANPGDPNYDLKQLALNSLSHRIYPNFCNGNWSEAHEDDSDIDTIFSTMGKRKLQPI